MKTSQSRLKKVSDYFAKVATAIVSGAPGRKFFFRPENKIILQPQETSFKPDSEKHYHRSKSKPAVEKQTLLKEKKKAKTAK